MRVGVDEAGRGPVIGSMFAVAVRADVEALPPGVGDSKAIPRDRRTDLAAKIRESADAVGVAEVTVDRIDDPAVNMTDVTVAAHVEAVAAVKQDDLVVTLDAGEIDADRFARRVAADLPDDLRVSACHGADASDPLVGAASIVAKVARDEHVAQLAAIHGTVGSGYPSDQTTRDFLATYVNDHGCLPDCARRSWQTSQDLLAAAEQSSLDSFASLVSDT